MNQQLTAAAQCVSLSGKATEQAMELSYKFKSFVALQRFVQPQYEDEAQDHVPATRGEMDAMLETLNADVLRRMDALADTLTVLGAQARLSVTSLAPSPSS